MSIPKKILLVAGARPNFMKVAPLYRELSKYPDTFAPLIVHTGQHYDVEMSDVFFQELELPRPDRLLGVGSGSHAEQTAKIIIAFEGVCREERPDLVVVVGDVNSTMACAITAKKLRIPVAHVEAGLRSRDWTMPRKSIAWSRIRSQTFCLPLREMPTRISCAKELRLKKFTSLGTS